MSAAERKWPVIVDDNSTRVSKPDYSWRKDNAPPLPKDLWSDDSTPAPVAMPTATRVVEGQLQKKAKRPGFFKTHHRISQVGLRRKLEPGLWFSISGCWLKRTRKGRGPLARPMTR